MTALPTVMLVDDEQLLLRAIVRMLAGSYDVLTYERGDAALSHLCFGGSMHVDAIL